MLLLCALDVDSLCACKILQAMFKADDVEHTVIPVAGKEDVKTAYKDHAHLVKRRGLGVVLREGWGWLGVMLRGGRVWELC